ncbi:MAG: IS110 family transposase [Chloroflexi bacterium]|nr:MAG: IS110 family transposase [Chloroflexota bacterium]
MLRCPGSRRILARPDGAPTARRARSRPRRLHRGLLQTIPGVKPIAAAAILAEIGTDVSRFPSAGHLASWAGLCPSNKESAGKRMKAPMNHGNVWLRGMMGEVAWASIRTRATYFRAQFRRLSRRRGPKKAAVAVAHTLLIVIYHVLRAGEPHTELGGDYFNTLSQRASGTPSRSPLRTAGLQGLAHPPLAA